MIKIFLEDKKNFIDKYGQELADLFFQNKSRLPGDASDISVWEREFKRNPKIARKKLKSYLDEFSSNTEVNQFQDKFGSALYTRFNSIKNLLPAKQKSYKYWLHSTKDELWDVIDEYLPNSYWNKVSAGAELIKETDEWEIYKITNYEASEYYGRGTGWCTSGNYPGHENNGLTFFNRYAKVYYFYFNKNTGALYNRFRKNPDQPGNDIQVWQGITDDGRTVDNQTPNISLPKIKDLDGEEKKTDAKVEPATNNTNNTQNNRQINVIKYTDFEDAFDDADSCDALYQDNNGEWYVSDEDSYYEAHEIDFNYELGYIVWGGRFPEEYFTNEEIIQINEGIGLVEGSNQEIISAYRMNAGYDIVGEEEQRVLNTLEYAISELFEQRDYVEQNISRLLDWVGSFEASAFKLSYNNRYIYIGTNWENERSIRELHVIREYPERENNNRNNTNNNNNNIPPLEQRDEIQRGVFGYRAGQQGDNLAGIVSCEKVTTDRTGKKYKLTFENGETYNAEVYTLDDVCDYYVQGTYVGNRLLTDMINDCYTPEEVQDIIASAGGEGTSLEDVLRDTERRCYIFDQMYGFYDFVDIMIAFVMEMSSIYRVADTDAEHFVFENGEEWFCLV